MDRLRQFGAKYYNPFYPFWLDKSIFHYLYRMPIGSRIINIGSGNTRLREDILNLDIKKFPNVDIVADARSLPFDNYYFDCVFCSAVLEHTSEPWIVADEIQRVLKPNGIACIQSPFLEAIHDDEDYFRFTLKGLKSLFPKLKELKSGVSSTSNQVLADILRVYPTFIFEDTLFSLPVKFAMSWIAKPFQSLDGLIKNPCMSNYARSFYFVGQKVA